MHVGCRIRYSEGLYACVIKRDAAIGDTLYNRHQVIAYGKVIIGCKLWEGIRVPYQVLKVSYRFEKVKNYCSKIYKFVLLLSSP